MPVTLVAVWMECVLICDRDFKSAADRSWVIELELQGVESPGLISLRVASVVNRWYSFTVDEPRQASLAW